ncbi:MAG: PadR family transcriptional regulator [Anaerolineae bacterium]|nr:PadR family transcriptional regulator [Anaerolineae bacterium]
MKLTGRQQAFLSDLMDLYGAGKEPLHYAAVAERLGIGRITAYDMLRLLEEKGLLTSEYVMPTGGPGRSSIVFRPTDQGEALVRRLAGDTWDREEWETVKAHIIQALQAGRGSGYEALLEEILARLPERKTPLAYTGEMVTAVILSLHQLREEVPDSRLWERLRDLGLPEEIGLSALGGLAVGLSLIERANRRLAHALLSATRQYQDYLAGLSAESRRRLSEFTAEVMRIVGT